MRDWRCWLPPAARTKEVAPPAELVDFDPVVDIDRVWSTGTKGGDDVLRLGLRPAVDGDRVYVAGHGGDVQALELANGREVWRVDTDLELAGGPAVGEGIVVVGSSDGSSLHSIPGPAPSAGRSRLVAKS